MLITTALITILTLWLAIWSIDRAINKNKIGRGITVIGQDIGGLHPSELSDVLLSIATSYASTPVIIKSDLGDIQTTTGEVGITVHIEETFKKILELDDVPLIVEPFHWVKNLFAERSSPIAVQLRKDQNFKLPVDFSNSKSEPIEPVWKVENGQVEFINGVPAQIFNEEAIRNSIFLAAATGASPIVVNADFTEIRPVVSDSEAADFAEIVNDLTKSGLTIIVGERTHTFSPEEVRNWLIFSLEDEQPSWVLNKPLVRGAIGDQLGGVVADKNELPEIIVNDGELSIVNLSAKACCAEDSVDLIYQSMLNGASSVNLQLIDITDGMDELLMAYGVSELISEATTPHPCCQSRVTNIQRFAELIQGTIIGPGDSLSLNEAIGKRTEAKGFVEAGVIVNGELTEDVGGGISQFATTFFQAAFYGGLDIVQYFPHTIWFSRYADFEGRKGIESTISWPSPNLEVRNISPFPILVWPTWTSTSLTVSLYSTKYAETEVSGQRSSMSDQCENIQTTRRRLLPDGSEELDTFSARYQPENGIGCNGEPTYPRPPDPPTNIGVQAGDTQITISWDIPEPEGNFDITEYFPITSYTVTASPGGNTCTTVELTCVISGLDNGALYTFVVIATNSEGDSEDSDPSIEIAPEPDPEPEPTPTPEPEPTPTPEPEPTPTPEPEPTPTPEP